MLSSNKGYGENNKDSINSKAYRTASQFQICFISYFFSSSNGDYFAGKLPLGKKSEKTSQKIPEMGMILEFLGNLTNSSQGMITQLMLSLEYIQSFI